MEKKVFSTEIGGKKLVCEFGEVAKQTRGGVLVNYGDTVVLSVVVSKEVEVEQDFFPLMVLYQEKLYAAGKIPGSFLKREGRPTEHETLTSRLIDRPIRPLFPEGYKNEVQIINTVLSSDPDCSSSFAALLGSSIALSISDIPFNGPIAGVEVGLIDGAFIINPTIEEKAKSSLELTVSGTKEAINMVESGCKELDEDVLLEALLFGHEEIKKIISFIDTIVKEIGVPKAKLNLFTIDESIVKEVSKFVQKDLIAAVSIKDKLARYEKIDSITNSALTKFSDKEFFVTIGESKVFDFKARDIYLAKVKKVCDEIVRKEVRRLITVDKIRPDGRKVDEIRPLSSRVRLLPRVHGSALFTRGQTQSLATVTLSSLKDNQLIDGLTLEDSKRFMLHYNFPQFSVGETGRYGNPGRREIGHGYLGERAIAQVIPNEEEFPYTIRVVSEILESNGSSSQATICAASLALMDAGVPIKAPVAGIAMGLIKEGSNYTILTDIQGMEDHEGDMDFKVAGTKNGITALQMDIKISGINKEILKEALQQAKKGRLHILEHMSSTLPCVSRDLSTYAPKIKIIKVNPDKIKDIIGGGGKVINAIIERNTGVKIDIEQDGRVFIIHYDQKVIDSTVDEIEAICKEAELNKIYEGTVVRIEVYGCFVKLWKGCEGMCHISKLDKKRVEKVEDVVKIGDVILVKVIKIDEKGRLDLSRKDAMTSSKI